MMGWMGLAFVFWISVSIFFRELTHTVDEKKSRNKSGVRNRGSNACRGLSMVVA